MKGNHLSNIPDPKRKMTNLEGLNGTHVRDIVKSRKGETGQGRGATMMIERGQVKETKGRLPEPGALREKIAALVAKIDNPMLLERVYQFIKYIYIHKT